MPIRSTQHVEEECQVEVLEMVVLNVLFFGSGCCRVLGETDLMDARCQVVVHTTFVDVVCRFSGGYDVWNAECVSSETQTCWFDSPSPSPSRF